MPRVLESRACLRFFGDDLNPDEVTAKLGHPPTGSAVRGEVERRPSGRERVHKRGSWRLRADHRKPGDLDAQILEILGKLTFDLSIWSELNQRFQADIFCGLFLEESNEGISISPTAAKMVGERGLEIDFDIYGGNGEE